MSTSDPIRIDDARSEKLVELTDGAIDPCFQCGTCTAVCPWGLVAEDGMGVRRLIRSAQLGLDQDEAVAEELWRCTTCRACEERCPRGVSITQAVIGLRTAALRERRAPERFEEVLWSILENANPDGFAPSQRMGWTADLELPEMRPGIETLLYFGPTACYDPRIQRVARGLVGLLRATGKEFGVLDDEPASGELVHAIGDDAYFSTLAEANVEKFEQLGVSEMIVLSPHDYDAFRRLYGKHGGEYRVFHATQYISHLVESGAITFGRDESRRAVYHDPCYLGRFHDVYDPPRTVLAAMPGLEVVEFAHAREDGLCCGGGGGRMWLETEAGQRFSDLRVKEAAELGADYIVTACPYCIQNFEDSLKITRIEGIKIVDVVEIAVEWEPITSAVAAAQPTDVHPGTSPLATPAGA